MSVSIKRIVGAVLAIVLVTLFLPNLLNSQVRSSSRAYDRQKYIEPNEALIRSAVMSYIAEQGDQACVKTALFPYESIDDSAACKNCEVLADAGLLRKQMQTGAENGQSRASARFELTSRGQPLYRQSIGDSRSTPGFCFGKTVLDQLDMVVVRQGRTEIRVTAHAHVEDAHEMLFTARTDDLGLPRLKRLAFDGRKLPPLHLTAKLDGEGAYQSLHRE